jgi:hypothetical protein
VVQGSHVAARAIVMQRKTQRPVQFEITKQTRDAVESTMRRRSPSKQRCRIAEGQRLPDSTVADRPVAASREFPRKRTLQAVANPSHSLFGDG